MDVRHDRNDMRHDRRDMAYNRHMGDYRDLRHDKRNSGKTVGISVMTAMTCAGIAGIGKTYE